MKLLVLIVLLLELLLVLLLVLILVLLVLLLLVFLIVLLLVVLELLVLVNYSKKRRVCVQFISIASEFNKVVTLKSIALHIFA